MSKIIRWSVHPQSASAASSVFTRLAWRRCTDLFTSHVIGYVCIAQGVAPSEAFAVPPPLSDEELARSYQNSSLKTSLLPTAAAASAAIEQTSATIDQAFTSMYQAAQNYRLPWQKTNAV
jgi:hypothetical protein